MVNLVQSLEPRYNTAASHRGMPETSFKKKEKSLEKYSLMYLKEKQKKPMLNI